MANEDTIHLLKECNAGVKMATKSFDEVIDRVKDIKMREQLEESRKKHQEIEKKTESRLQEYGEEDKEPNKMATAMAWMKINFKYATEPTDSEIASLMIDGCNMGIQSISRYFNKYPAADEEVKKMVDDIVKLEQKLMDELRFYLN